MLSPFRLLRRCGGLRRIVLLAICIVSLLLLAQSLLNGDESSGMETKTGTVSSSSRASTSTPSRSTSPRTSPSSPRRVAEITSHVVVADKNIVFGNKMPMCGVTGDCPVDTHMSMSFYSGTNHEDEPRLCVDGRFVISRGLNKAGRGLNMVTIDPVSRHILRVAHFDTYAEDSNAMEIFLEQIGQGHLLAVVSFDEASTKLTSLAKQLLYDLGSGMVQNMKFRSSWYFVGQRGISGFSPFEQLNYAHNSQWAKPVDARLCVPLKLDGQKTRVDPPPLAENTLRRSFCHKYDGYEEFCNDEHVDDLLTAAPSLARPVDSSVPPFVPLLIVAGLSHNSLRLCLETVLRQPALNASQVLVVHDENYDESAALAQLFGFAHRAVNASSSYARQYAMALQTVFDLFPDATEVIVIEEELLLTVDFLHYMHELVPVLRGDVSLVAVSAWNDNSFECTAFVPEVCHRVSSNSTSMLAFMLRRDTYDGRLKGRMGECCAQRAWHGWVMGEGDVIVPDTSRVVRRNVDGLAGQMPLVRALFHPPRTHVKSYGVALFQPSKLGSPSLYDEHLRSLISTGRPLNSSMLIAVCGSAIDVRDVDLLVMPHGLHNLQAAILYITDERATWGRLTACLGLVAGRGMYRGTMRLSRPPHHQLIIVSSSSPYYGIKPSSLPPLSLAV